MAKKNKWTGWDLKSRWTGFDLDGTLAQYNGWRGIDHIGEPIPAMVRQVKKMIHGGETVKIFTARMANGPEAIPPIHAWLKKQGIYALEVTNVKDYHMTKLYDDRCVQIVPGTGLTVAQYHNQEIEKKMSGDKLVVIILCGLPRSGKTTWAKEFCYDQMGYIHINADAMRLAVYGQAFDGRLEPMVHGAVHAMGSALA